MPDVPGAAFSELIPDWVCEVLSPSTSNDDRGRKRRIYATYGLAYLWLLDPAVRELEAFELRDGKWVLLDLFSGDDEIVAAPFGAASFPLSVLWPPPQPK